MNAELIKTLRAAAPELRKRNTYREGLAATDLLTAADHLEAEDKKRAEAVKAAAPAPAPQPEAPAPKK
jgi:hypothetical protein